MSLGVYILYTCADASPDSNEYNICKNSRNIPAHARAIQSHALRHSAIIYISIIVTLHNNIIQGLADHVAYHFSAFIINRIIKSIHINGTN